MELRTLDAARELEPNLADGVRLALSSPTGAIFDGRAYVMAMAEEAGEAGVSFRFNRRVVGADRLSAGWRLILDDGTLLDSARVVNAAGAHVDEVAALFGWRGRYRIVPFRGRYWSVKGKDDIIRSMVYPTPDPHFPFLGVHVTRRVHGGVMLGPNAMLALGRDAYSFWKVQSKDVLGMVRARGFWNLMRRPDVLRLAATEVERSLRPQRFAAEAARLVRGIGPQDLAPGPPAGIRAQLVDDQGELVEDFLLDVRDDAAHILNAVSPGLTSSMAFARYLVDSLKERDFLTASPPGRSPGAPRPRAPRLSGPGDARSRTGARHPRRQGPGRPAAPDLHHDSIPGPGSPLHRVRAGAADAGLHQNVDRPQVGRVEPGS